MSSWSDNLALVAICLLALCSGLINGQSDLRINSGGVDYTNGTFYAPFGSSFTVHCEGGMGERRWYVIGFGRNQMLLPTDSTQVVYQSSGQLLVSDFQQSEAEQIFCEDEGGSTVFTNLAEGVIITSAAVTSTSITVFWDLPSQVGSTDNMRASCCIVSQPNTCSNNNEVQISNGNFSVGGLEEFTAYSCLISGVSAAYEVSTLGDVPSSPPEGVQLVPVSSTSLRLEWGLPEAQGRNGIITQYLVECTGPMVSVQSPVVPSSPTFDAPPSHQQLLTGLAPFTQYSCRVAAVNVNGTGPFSALANTTTLEGLPGPVANVNTSRMSDEVVLVNWSAPEEPNGILQHYVLVYREYDRSASEDMEINVFVPNTSFGIPGLSPGVPYSVVVRAVTGAGRGAESERVTFFSKELAPTLAVSGVNATRESDIEMTVRWTELSLREARGYPMYTVLYEPITGPVGRVGRQAAGTGFVTQPPVTIGGLDPGTTYSVQVRVDTNGTAAGGSGPVSQSVTVQLFMPPSTRPVGTPTVSVAAEVTAAVLVPLILLVGALIVLAAIPSFFLWRRRKKLQNVEGGYSGMDVKRSISQDTSNSFCMGSKNELVARSVERSPPAANVVVCSGGPPIPEREPRGELVVSLSPSPAVTANGHSIVRDSPDEDELLMEQIDQLAMPDISKERQYVNLLPPVKAKNFVKYVQRMRQDGSFPVEYSGIPFRDFTATQEAGLANLDRNRYRKVIPYDHSRVRLSGENDYINASYIAGYDKKNRYIASQGPKVQTIGDFWQMVWEHKSTVIVMLTKLDEKGRTKCAQYWSDAMSEPYKVGNGLVVTLLEVKPYAEYEMKTFSLGEESGAGSHLHIHHFQFTIWPDHGVPRYPTSLIKFVQTVQQHYSKDSQAPMVVHCSAGVGRSGTFIAVDAMMERLKEKDDINIYEFLYSMRCDRPFMIQNVEQYIFVHDLMCDYVGSGDTSVAAHALEETVAKLTLPAVDDGITGFEQQFGILGQLSRNPGKEDESFAEANVEKNRYAARFPYQSNCLFVPGPRAVRYVNASLIDSYAHSKGFIATQMPLPASVEDVMELVIQKQCATVLVLCTDEEMTDDISMVKFWPEEDGQSVKYGRCTVQLLSSSYKGSCTVNNIELLLHSELRTEEHHFTLIHVHDWSENSEPEASAMWGIIEEYEKAQKGFVERPTVVMCNDGMGRTGAFICMCSEVERIRMEGITDVFQSVKAARTQRPYMVSTVEQYMLVHNVLSAYVETFTSYANYKKSALV